MRFFVSAVTSEQSKRTSVIAVRYSLAMLLSIMVVSQLFTYEKFSLVLSGYSFLGGSANASIVAAVLVTLEVFSLPFLLGVALSPLMKIVSLLCGFSISLIWIMSGLWVVMQVNALINSGILGATIVISPGLWQVVYGLMLLVGFGYVAESNIKNGTRQNKV